MAEILYNFLIAGALSYFLLNIWAIMKQRKDSEEEYEEQEEQEQLPSDWIFPLNLEYNDEAWYAWDIDGNFILQSASKDTLLTEILNKYEIPPKRLAIQSEKRIDEK